MKTYYQEINTTGFTFWKETLGCIVKNEFWEGGGSVQECGQGGCQDTIAKFMGTKLVALALEMKKTGEKIHMEEQVQTFS